MPKRFQVPPDFKEAMLIMELGFPPEVLDKIPENTLQMMLIYKGVRDVHQFGGEYDP